ncbi:MAG TPA: integrin alpha, partial [Myxococcota bacterium]|nr:integrin alpha [Myxococcota bacterium]
LHLGPFAATERASTPDGSYPNALQSDYFGWTLSGPGEVNGDVYDDFIIGGPLTDTSVGADAGMIYLIPGAVAGYSANLSTFTYVSGAAAGDQFGYDVALIGDVDGDTYSEFIVGAPYQDNPAVDAGRVYFYYTPLSGSAQAADGILKGEATLDHLGWAVAGARDLDGDGFDDFIVSAPDNDAVASAAGKAYLFLNPPSGTVNATTADAFFRGAAASDQLGYDLAMAEDINGDGTDDLIIGAPGNDDAGSGYGKAYLWWGEAFSGTYAASSADESIVGTYTNDGIGYRVAGAGDINQDGYGDVLAAGPLSSDFATNAGKVLYVHGPVTNRTPFIWMGATANDEAGRGLAAVDDQDLNGFPEYAIGSQDANANAYGEVYVRQGATSNR